MDKWKPNNTDDTMNYMYPFDETQFLRHPDPTQIFTPSFFYEELLSKMNDLDPPEVYGQYINAEISSQINDSKDMLSSILSITPQKASGGGGGNSGVIKLLRDLQERVPEEIDQYKLKIKLRGDENPLNVVLKQEVQRFGVLIRKLAIQLVQLERGSLGLEVISPEGEEIIEALAQNKVPIPWSFAYFS